MATENGSDTQINWFSITNSGMAYGLGGPSPALYDGPIPTIFSPPDPNSYDAILKISDGISFKSLSGLGVAQGWEDCVNFNNGVHNVTLKGNYGITGSQGKRVFTVKGGCKAIYLSGTISTHGLTTDVEIDAWSDQNYDSSEVDISGLSMVDGSKVRFISRLGSKVKISDNQQIDWIGSIGLTAYWWFKFLVRKILGIKQGTPGPKWLA